MSDDWQVATWRYEQIAPLIDEGASEAARRAYVRERSTHAVDWPRSKRARRAGDPPRRKPISRATLLRWAEAYRADGFVGLLPKTRSDKGRSRSDRSAAVDYALGLLYEQPDRSLNQLLLYLAVEFEDVSISRSTLHRDLVAHPAYAGAIRRREGRSARKQRRSYQAKRPHQIWQLDAKHFSVRIAGVQTRVCVLSVLEAFSRVILAGIVAPTESLAGAVRVTRLAIAKYGVADRYQFDRHSAYDAWAFREGLGLLGVHRNWVKAKNPEAQGLIEAYHRFLDRWFVRELRCQQVLSLAHLQTLLQASVDLLYNRHHHRKLGMSPEEALAGRLSDRRVSDADLRRAFWARIEKKPHPKTGEVELPNGCFRVPSRFAGRGRACRFHFDPVEPNAVLVAGNHRRVELEPFVIEEPFAGGAEERGTGQLQKIVDLWRGASRPNAQPGFGLPEVFRLIEGLVGHRVPQDEREATAITDFYSEFGPLPREPLIHAVEQTRTALGEGRPLSRYLDHLARQIRQASPTDQEPRP